MTTYHAIQRVKQRTNIERGSEERFIKNAIARGRGAETFNGIERDYLKSYEIGGDCYAVAYNSYCFIFNENDICITMYPLPAWFGKKKLFNGKTKIRSIRKFVHDYILRELEIEEYELQCSPV